MNARVENQRRSLQSAENLLLLSLRFASRLHTREARRAVQRWGSLASLNFRLCDRSSTRNPPTHLARIMHAHIKRDSLRHSSDESIKDREKLWMEGEVCFDNIHSLGIKTCFEVLKLLRLHIIFMNNKFFCFHALSVPPDQASHWTFAENIHLLINLKNLFAFYWFEERRKKRGKQNEQSFLARFTTKMEEKFGLASGVAQWMTSRSQRELSYN